jgi:hypothetical protein
MEWIRLRIAGKQVAEVEVRSQPYPFGTVTLPKATGNLPLPANRGSGPRAHSALASGQRSRASSASRHNPLTHAASGRYLLGAKGVSPSIQRAALSPVPSPYAQTLPGSASLGPASSSKESQKPIRAAVSAHWAMEVSRMSGFPVCAESLWTRDIQPSDPELVPDTYRWGIVLLKTISERASSGERSSGPDSSSTCEGVSESFVVFPIM